MVPILATLPLARCLLMLVVSFMVFRELESAGNMSDNLQMLGASMEKANSIDGTPTMDIDGQELTPTDTSISFVDVSFSYGERKILDHISLSVPGGTTTAVVGPSGGGKTTLCNLIARFWDVQDGSICVGGHDVRDYKLDTHVRLEGAACGLFRDSTVLLEQVRTLDKSRLGEYMGSVGEDKMWEVDAALHISVGLAETYR